MSAPLAERLRPKKLSDYVGQKHLLTEGGFLWQSIKNGRIPSMLLWGPPGVGKTSLAEIISHECGRPFFALSAINSGVKDIRDIIDRARNPNLLAQGAPILFIDEIHRFSKSQQDSLLAAVERGWVTLIGATTENPSFEVIPALRSRCQLYVLEPLTVAEMEGMLQHALKTDTQLQAMNIQLLETEALIAISGGDARKLLNALELVCSSVAVGAQVNNELVKTIIQKNIVSYDKGGEQHYNVISAFIKSIRGSDPNAAVYWLARMLLGGEEPRFVARRLVILASEDIGLANPNAMLIASQCMDAVHQIGMPESRIILSNCAIYLATSPKSNSAYMAINEAYRLAEETHHLPVPLDLRNAVTKDMKNLNYGANYQYSHSGKNNFVSQHFMPEQLQGTKIYEPGANARERDVAKTLAKLWKDIYSY